jgi:hypothetical protein
VIGLEFAGYIWELNTARGEYGWTLVGARRIELSRRGDHEQPYYLMAPNREYEWSGVPVRIGPRGFRTPEFGASKPPETYRILNLGDSVVFGWQVAEAETYGRRLESLLNGADGNLRYEVINAGVPAWNLESERNFLLQEGLSYQPDLVLLEITLVNDIYGQGPSISETPRLTDWLRDRTFAWPFLTTGARLLISNTGRLEALPVLNPPKEAEAYFPISEEDPAWNRVWTTIDDMIRACRERNIELVIMAVPTAFQLHVNPHPDIPQRVLRSRSQSAGVAFIDFLPSFRKECQIDYINSCEGFRNRLFVDVWMHPSDLGHEIMAQEVFHSRPWP